MTHLKILIVCLSFMAAQKVYSICQMAEWETPIFNKESSEGKFAYFSCGEKKKIPVSYLKKIVSSSVTAVSSKTNKFTINPKVQFQKVIGFGGAMTDACLQLWKPLNENLKNEFLTKLFTEPDGFGLDFVRIPLGGNDFSSGDYTLDDSPKNVPDPELKYFNGERLKDVIEFVKKAKEYNPQIKTLVSPWTAPAWMKNTKSLKGGKIEKKHYQSYADYLIRSLTEFEKQGVHIDYLTFLNEPLMDYAEKTWPTPQAYMPAVEQVDFLKNHLIPTLQKNKNITTQLLLHDHNWDMGEAVATLLSEKSISDYAGGIAWHCYTGDLETAKLRLKQFEGRFHFNSECTSQLNKFKERDSFYWWLRNMTLQPMQFGMSGGLGWNLCLDQTGKPNNGGPQDLQGLITFYRTNSKAKNSTSNIKVSKKNQNVEVAIAVDSSPNYKLNPELYALGVTGKFLLGEAVRIQSEFAIQTPLIGLAFQNPDQSTVVIIENPTPTEQSVVFDWNEMQSAPFKIPSSSVLLFRWK